MDVGGDKGNIRSDINVTPLVDVCLVLLIIFMVVTPMLGTAEVSLPQADDPSKKPEEDKQVTLFVASNPPGLFVGDKKFTKDQFEKELDEIYQRSPNKPIVIKADKRLNWGDVRDVMKIVKDAGFENVGLIAEKKQK
jgi:biopolymer transport protein ExbD